MNTQDICNDCGGCDMVYDWKNGDVVCKACGLVQYGTLFDDSVLYSAEVESYEHEHESNQLVFPNKPWLKTTTKDINPEFVAFNSLIYEACYQDSQLASTAWTIFSEFATTTGHKGRKRLALKAAAVYKASSQLNRGYTADFVIRLFGGDIDNKLFFETVGAGDRAATESAGIIKRAIYSVPQLKTETTWEAYRMAQGLFDRVHKNPLVSNKCQNKKLIAVIVCITVRVLCNGIDISGNMGVSKSTLNKIEGLIQEALQQG